MVTGNELIRGLLERLGIFLLVQKRSGCFVGAAFLFLWAQRRSQRLLDELLDLTAQNRLDFSNRFLEQTDPLVQAIEDAVFNGVKDEFAIGFLFGGRMVDPRLRREQRAVRRQCNTVNAIPAAAAA